MTNSKPRPGHERELKNTRAESGLEESSAISAQPALDFVTAVILNFGTPDYTIRSVEALIADGFPPERIVVVDNGSADDSYERFQQRLARCLLLRLEENVGFSQASNIGARGLTGDSYLFVNNDAFLHTPGSIRGLVARLQDEAVGIVAPRILNEDLTLQPTVVPTTSPAVALVRASGLSRFIPNRWQPRWSTHWDHLESREVQAVSGAVLLVRGKAWEELGGFEERLAMYGEDLDLCWRARKRGWKVWFTPDASFIHVGQGSVGRHWTTARRAEATGRADAAMIRHHLPQFSALLTIAFIASGLAARWLFFSVVGDRQATAALRGALRGYLSQSRFWRADR